MKAWRNLLGVLVVAAGKASARMFGGRCEASGCGEQQELGEAHGRWACTLHFCKTTPTRQRTPHAAANCKAERASRRASRGA